MKLKKNIIIISFVSLLVLSGCGSKNEPLDENNNTINQPNLTESIKIDENKPYLESVDTSEKSLESVLKESDRIEEYEIVLENVNSSLLPTQPASSIFSNEKININIKSNSATELQNYLDQLTEENTQAQATGINSIVNENSDSFSWGGITMLDSFENEKYISFSTVNRSFMYPGHLVVSLDAYVFDAVTGDRLSGDALLKSLNISATDIDDYLNNNLFSENISFIGEVRIPKLVKDLNEARTLFEQDPMTENIYLKIKTENAFAVSNNDT